MDFVFDHCQDESSDATFDIGAMVDLHQAGWSTGYTAIRDEDGQVIWLVDGQNGENAFWAEGATLEAAWESAVGQARGLGMMERSKD